MIPVAFLWLFLCLHPVQANPMENPVVQYLSIVILIFFSALFSGLTLGLLGLDKIGLEIIIGAGESDKATAQDKINVKYAQTIQPLRENGNHLLCTLLLGNVAVNAALSILMADLTSGMLGFLVSTAAIVIFGEIVPQALCSRYALRIGSAAVPLVRVIMYALYIIAKPISMVLDVALGEEIGTIHNKSELEKLVQIHVQHNALDSGEANIMKGAITYKDKKVSDVMTSLEDVHMLCTEDKLDFKTISQIFKSGYSRIPVYKRDKNDIVGLLFTKDLIFIDPEDETPVRNFIHIFGRWVQKTFPDTPLDDMLKQFKRGKAHMSLVHDVNSDGEGDPFYEIKGIVTLEDIIEEILGEEIVDETDVYIQVEHHSKVDRQSFDYAKLRLLDHRLVDEQITDQECKAIVAHLQANYSEVFQKTAAGTTISSDMLAGLLHKHSVSTLKPTGQNAGEEKAMVYKRGKKETWCTVLLNGKMMIQAGRDGFRSEAGAWSVLAAECLVQEEGAYISDFTAYVAENTRCIRISCTEYMKMFDRKKILEPISENDGSSKDSKKNGDASEVMLSDFETPVEKLKEPIRAQHLETKLEESTREAHLSENKTQI